MKSFIHRYAAKIIGILNGFDRLVFSGSLRLLQRAPGMARLRELELVDVIRSLTQPVLGVCLGMQLLCEHSEESDTPCLGVIAAEVRRFEETPELCVPGAPRPAR